MSIFHRILAFLEGGAPLATDKNGEPADPQLKVATAALLLEMAHHDDEYVHNEQKTILRGLEREFGLSRDDAFYLLARAERTRPKGGDMSAIGEQILSHYDHEQRKRIAVLAWKVVYADQIVDEAEVELAGRMMVAGGLTPEEAQEAREKGFAWFSTKRTSDARGRS